MLSALRRLRTLALANHVRLVDTGFRIEAVRLPVCADSLLLFASLGGDRAEQLKSPSLAEPLAGLPLDGQRQVGLCGRGSQVSGGEQDGRQCRQRRSFQ
jgi:hypothetical protein